MSERAARSRELVAAGYRPAVVARVARISRQAIYRVPRRRPAERAARRSAAGRRGRAGDRRDLPKDDHQSDGYRMITAIVQPQAGRRGQPQARAAGHAAARPDAAAPPAGAAEAARVLLRRAAGPAVAPGRHLDLGGRERVVSAAGDHRLLHPRDRRLPPGPARPRRRGHQRDRAGRGGPRHRARHAHARHRQRLGVHRPRDARRAARARHHSIAAAATATPKARPSSSPGSANSRNGRSGATSTKRSTTPSPACEATSTATTSGRTRAWPTRRHSRSPPPGDSHPDPNQHRPKPSTTPGSRSGTSGDNT